MEKNDDDKNTKFKALTFETLKYSDSWNVIKKLSELKFDEESYEIVTLCEQRVFFCVNLEKINDLQLNKLKQYLICNEIYYIRFIK
jgi:hypothetical protein